MGEKKEKKKLPGQTYEAFSCGIHVNSHPPKEKLKIITIDKVVALFPKRGGGSLGLYVIRERLNEPRGGGLPGP